MKFDFEKINARFIDRKVREAQKADKLSRRVTTVRLSPPEWAEFLSSENRYYNGAFPEVLKMRGPMPPISTFSPHDPIYPEDILTIDVVLDRNA